MGVVTAGLGFQTEEVAKERKGRRNSKESFAKMNKNREMEDNIGSKMVQGNLKVTKEAMKKKQRREDRVRHERRRQKEKSPQDLELGPDVGLRFSNRQIPYPGSGHR
jgi:hypothetical protein